MPVVAAVTKGRRVSTSCVERGSRIEGQDARPAIDALASTRVPPSDGPALHLQLSLSPPVLDVRGLLSPHVI